MTSLRKYPNAYRMLSRISAGHQALFTPAQIQALEDALAPRTHLLDLRMSLPLMGKGAYFVFMGGPNRREQPRDLRSNATALRENTPAGMPAALSRAAVRRKTRQRNSAAYRMLQRIPNQIMTTFTPAQIRAMEAALVPRSHMIDIRLSTPWFGKGAYLVFVAGPNRRAHYRDIQNGNPFVMPAVFASVVLAAGSILGLVHLKGSDILAEPDPIFDQGPGFYHTIVPFKKNQRECMESGRQWIEGKCIDETHDPNF